MKIKAKKYLGQHFLKDENIAKKIVNSLSSCKINFILEVGPGMGMLTKYLLKTEKEIFLSEIDQESITYLKENYSLNDSVFVGDFLKINFNHIFAHQQVSVIGNFPYNISSQILFQIIDNYQHIPEIVGMFQKEVAQRIVAIPRTKDYSILSVMVQAYYETEYLFTVHEKVFNPPPKVKSSVIKLIRNPKKNLRNNEKIFRQILKAGFGQRRKKLSNSLKILNIPDALTYHNFLSLRAEELSVEDFISFAKLWKEALSKSFR